MLEYEVTARSEAPPETVWAMLADGPSWPEWAGPLAPKSMWEREGVTEPGGVGAIRKMGAPPVWSREEIIEFEPPRHMAYTLLSGLPIKDYRADVTLIPDGTGTAITWKGRFNGKIPGTGPIFVVMLRTIVGGFAKRLAAAAAAQPRHGG